MGALDERCCNIGGFEPLRNVLIENGIAISMDARAGGASLCRATLLRQSFQAAIRAAARCGSGTHQSSIRPYELLANRRQATPGLTDP